MKPLLIGTIIMNLLFFGLFPPATAFLCGGLLWFFFIIIGIIVSLADGDSITIKWDKVDD